MTKKSTETTAPKNRSTTNKTVGVNDINNNDLSSTEILPVAGGGILDRRLFLKRSLIFTTATLITESSVEAAAEGISPTNSGQSPSMLKPGNTFSNYGLPSPYESQTIRWVSANAMADGNGVSWCPLHELEGIITPNGLHYERHHNGVPDIDPANHQLLIHGLVERPLTFSIDDLKRYPMESRICFVECGGNSNAGWNKRPVQAAAGHIHGLVSCSEWTGVPLSILLHEAGIRPNASWLIAEAADGVAMNISIPVEKAMDDAILALYQNGERIRPENGYPLRLLLPGWEGVTNVKWLRRLQLTDQPVMSRNETAKYTELMPSGKSRQFTFEMEAKSLITSPCAGQEMHGAGYYQITGLAWSGKGKITKVEVSADGGKTWADSELQEPVLSKSFTRFRIPWKWDGSLAVIKSRATDETGYVQPERDVLVKERGRHGYFHYNAIVSWEIAAEGYVSYVYA